MLAEAARAARQAGARSSRSSAKAARSARPRRASRIARALAAELDVAGARVRATSAELVLSLKCGGSDYTSGLASNPALGRVADRLVDARRHRGARRDRRDHGRRAPAAPRAPRAGTTAAQLHSDHHPRRERSASARSRHPRHAALAGQHPRRPDDDRGEVARRDAQGRRARAARRRRRLRGADHAQGPDRHGHAGARRRVGDRHGRRRRAGRGVHDRPRHADRAIRSRRSSRSRATRARRRQMADNIDLDVSGIIDDTETLDAAADRLFDEVLAVASGKADRRRSGSATASSRSIAAIPPSDGCPLRPRGIRRIRATGGGARRIATAGSICGLLFFAATINYIDRQVIGILKPTLQAAVRLERDRLRRHRLRVPARLCDRVPVRRPHDGSARHQARFHARDRRLEPRRDGARARRRSSVRAPRRRARGRGSDLLRRRSPASSSRGSRSASARPATFPAAIKTVAEWFPQARARARDGHLQLRHEHRRASSRRSSCRGSRSPGAGTGRSSRPARSGSSGCCSGGRSTAGPTTHPRVGAAELALIRATRRIRRSRIPWRALLPHRQTWAFAIGKFMTDPIWWLYLFWIPDFLNRNHGFNLHDDRRRRWSRST